MPLYLLNVVIAALAIGAVGLLAGALAHDRRLALRHDLLCAAVGLMLVCPLALALSGRLDFGAVPVDLKTPTRDWLVAEESATAPAGAQDETSRVPLVSATSGRAVPAISRAEDSWNLPQIASRLAALAWLAGALVVLAQWIRGLAAIRRLRKSLVLKGSPRIAALASDASRRAGLARDLAVYTSPLAPGPLALGTWNPLIVLPEGIDEALADDELLGILAHEAAHVARRDALVALIERLAVVLYWWNPLLHAINRRIHFARECICDECAIAAGTDGDRFALALVKTGQWSLGPRAKLAHAAMLIHEHSLTDRITHLTHNEHPMSSRFSPTGLAAILAFAILAPAFVFVPVLKGQTKPAGEPKAPAAQRSADPARLSYNDGTAEDKRSLGGSGEMISFTLPDEHAKVSGIRIHGSRYGLPQPPKEDFMIYFLGGDGSEAVATKSAPYARFKRGEPGWVEIKFPKPIALPKEFWVCLDFRAQQTKGVYVSIDDSSDGSHSRVGLPGTEARETNFKGDWMIEVVLDTKAEGRRQKAE